MDSITSCPFCLLIGLGFMLVVTIACSNPNNPRIDDPVVVPADQMPAWSPGGERIAYWHLNPSPADTTRPTGLYVLELASGKRTLILEGEAFNPDWSPDGQWIVFNAGDIFKIRPDGSELKQVTKIGSTFFPAWNPDGKRIAFDVTVEEKDRTGIWLINPDGTNAKHLGLGRNPDWSSDGENLVYAGPSGSTDSESQIWKADTSGTDLQQLTTNAFVGNRAPAWSSDGQWIAWSALYGARDWGLWVMRSDGSQQRELLRLAPDRRIDYEHVAPAWSPDSKRLVISKPNPEEEKVTLWIINRDGSGLEQITF